MAEEWRRTPVSEQRFLFAETSNTIFDSLCFGRSSRSRTILDATYELETERPAGRRFNRYIHPDGDKNLIYRMMPSLTLVQVACKQLGGHVTPVIRLGASASLRQNGLRGERDISLRSKFVETPETADGNKAPYEEFTGHDFYHVQILSTIPKELQRASIGVADRLRELGYTKDADFLEDMEFNFPSNCTSDQDRLDFISSLLSQKKVYRKDPYELPPIIQTLLLDLFPKLKVGSEPSGATAPPDGK